MSEQDDAARRLAQQIAYAEVMLSVAPTLKQLAWFLGVLGAVAIIGLVVFFI